jgi:hypothetical protein
MCSSASPLRWRVQGVLSYTCTRDDREVDARSPIGEAGSQRTHKKHRRISKKPHTHFRPGRASVKEPPDTVAKTPSRTVASKAD